MKKTQFIELIKNIKSTFVSFFSVMMFVALGVGVYVGISCCSEALLNSMDASLDEAVFHDIAIDFPYGFSDEDIERLSEVEGVDEIEGSYFSFQYFDYKGETYQTKLFMLNEKIDRPIQHEGELPTEAGQVAISRSWAEETGAGIGDTIVFTSDDNGSSRMTIKLLDYDTTAVSGAEDMFGALESMKAESMTPYGMAYLTTDTFTVTAITDSPNYLNSDPNLLGVASTNFLTLNCFMYAAPESFDTTAFNGYPEVLIRSNSLRGMSSFGDKYTNDVTILAGKVGTVASEIAEEKCSDIHEQVGNLDKTTDEALQDAARQIADAERMIAQGSKQLKEAAAKLASAEKEINAGEQQLKEAREQFNEKKAQYDHFKDIYDKARPVVVDVIEALRNHTMTQVQAIAYLKAKGTYSILINLYDEYKTVEGYAEILAEVKATLELSDSTAEQIANALTKALNFLDSYIETVGNQLTEAENTLNEKEALLNQYKDQLSAAKKLLAQKNRELENGRIQLANGKEQYAMGLEQYNEFVEATAKLKDYDASIVLRKNNPSILGGTAFSKVFKKLCLSMASLFLIVGLLVCYSAISRIVNDQIVSIGTKKALGLSRKEVTTSYLSYTGLAVIAGCILGLLGGFLIVEKVLLNALGGSYVMNNMPVYVATGRSVVICLAEFVLIILVTWFACKKILARNAVDLLKGPKPPEGKAHFYEKSRMWNNFSLFTKTVVNNCMSDKRRVIGTLIGVAGCTALIVTAVTLNDNVMYSFEKQYSDLYHFDLIIYFEEGDDTDAQTQIADILSKHDAQSSIVTKTRVAVNLPNDTMTLGHVIVPQDDDFDKMISFEMTDKKAADPCSDLESGNFVLMPQSYEEAFKASTGDSVSLMSVDGTSANQTIGGFYKYYLINCQIMMSRAAYTEAFDSEATPNAFLVNTDGLDMEALEEELSAVDGYVSTTDYYSLSKRSFDAFKNVSKAMVAVYLLLSVLMAMLVLLNLLIMFVSEKKRELIVLMINGFGLKDARRYIYSDTILLTIVGIIFGLILGTIMGNLSVASFESEVTMFVHRIDWTACLIGAVLSAALAFVASVIALRQIKQFKLTDINKM